MTTLVNRIVAGGFLYLLARTFQREQPSNLDAGIRMEILMDILFIGVSDHKRISLDKGEAANENDAGYGS